MPLEAWWPAILIQTTSTNRWRCCGLERRATTTRTASAPSRHWQQRVRSRRHTPTTRSANNHGIGSLINPFQYTGREFDSETGLYHYRARYYDPLQGGSSAKTPYGLALESTSTTTS